MNNRVKCPSCKNVFDTNGFTCVCPKCNVEFSIPETSFLQVYRMGSPLGVAVGFGIYINGDPFGYVANKQSLRIPLPYGSYKLHFAQGMNRGGQDIIINLSPENPEAYAKVYMKPGFWSNKLMAEAAKKEDMPE